MSIFKKKKATAPRSVASITAGLSNTLAELEAHSEEQQRQAEFQETMAAMALSAADEHRAESVLAAKVAGNINALLSA